MINKVILVGRIANDLEIKKITVGNSVLNFSLAVEKKYSKKREVDYINCICWNKIADNLVKYNGKGSLIGITGYIQTNNYTTKEGKKYYKTEIYCEEITYIASKKKEQSEEIDYTKQFSEAESKFGISPDDIQF